MKKLKDIVGWRKDYAGRYVHHSGLAIEKAMDHPGWNIINPKTGRVHDSAPTKKKAMETYKGGWEE